MSRVAVFRPADERERRAVELLERRGFDVLSDPLLEPRSTGAQPRRDADFTVLTSVTGVDLVEPPLGGRLCAIGPRTASALRDAGLDVDVVPESYTSEGLVDALDGEVGGARVEVARSDHGSPALVDGLVESGAYVHETVLYRLVRPGGAGEASVAALREGTLDCLLFTSSLTVEHLLEALDESGVGRGVLDDVAVCVIGEPTRRTAEGLGLEVDVVAGEETFEALVDAAARELL